MPTTRRTSKRAATPWWLGGEEECPHCHQIYAYELEFRCPDCDAPCCPQCRSRSKEGHNACPECVDCARAEAVAHG